MQRSVLLLTTFVAGLFSMHLPAGAEELPLDWQQVLSSHNNVRDTVSAGGYANQPLPSVALTPMLADNSLVASAQIHANRCVWEHSADRINTGENLYASSDPATAIGAAVQAWADEYRFYSFNDNSCQPGQQCGHYTQLVWDESIAVGCAATRCAPLKTSSGSTLIASAVMIACQYKPAGNVVGTSPYATEASDVVFATYDGATQQLELPYFLVRNPDNLVIPYRVKLQLTGVDPITFRVIDAELQQIAYDATKRSPIYDAQTGRLFLSHVDVVSDTGTTHHSAVLEYIPGEGINLQLILFE